METAKEKITPDGFLMYKWAEEDGDGLNITIITERRKIIERDFLLWLKSNAHAYIDEYGQECFDINSLDQAWSLCHFE